MKRPTDKNTSGNEASYKSAEKMIKDGKKRIEMSFKKEKNTMCGSVYQAG